MLMKEKEIIKIERESESKREMIAVLPFASGSYLTTSGEVEMKVFPRDSQGQQKVVFLGNFIPTIKERGKKGQFISSGKRRVVDFSHRNERKISQDNGKNGRLIFSRSELLESSAAD